MSTLLQLRRGTLAQCQGYVPAIGELIVAEDQSPPQIFLGDGATAGGRQLVVAPDKLEATLSANQAIGASAWTAVVLDSALLDTNSLLDTGTGIATIKRAGIYLVMATVAISGTGVGIAGVAKNGASSPTWYGGSEAASQGGGVLERLASFNNGDTLTLMAYTNSAANILAADVNTCLSLIGPF